VGEPFAADNEGPVVGGAYCVKRLGVELDGTGPLAAGVETGACVAGIGAGENENEVPENGCVVLVSDLPLASPNCVFEDDVNKEGAREGSVARVSAFGSGGRENGGATV
jgi:hypothetical protein